MLRPMSEPAFQVSALLIKGFKKASESLGIADGARANMSPAVAAMWDQPASSGWHAGELFQGMTQALVKVSTKEQMADINLRLCRDQFGPIVGGMIRVAVALSSPSPHTVFGNVKQMIGLAMKGVQVDYQRTGPQSGSFAAWYPLPFPEETAWAWAGVMDFCCEIVRHQAVRDRVQTVQNGHRFEVDLHW